MKQLFSSRLLLVLFIIFAAFLAAFLGQIAITSLTSGPSLFPNDPLVVRQLETPYLNLLKTRDDVLQKEVAGLVEIYSQQDQQLSLASQGFILTNDGWIVAVAAEDSPLWTSVRLQSGKLLEISQQLQDPASGLIFLQVESTDLRPLTLGNGVDLSPLTTLVVVEYPGKLSFAEIVGRVAIDQVYTSSDEFSHFHLLSSGNTGNVVYNEKSEVVGLITKTSEAGAYLLSEGTIRDLLQMILRTGEIERPALQLSYVDLAHVPVLHSAAEGLQAGAFITNSITPLENEVLSSKSAAFQGGLRLNDVIVSLNGNLFNDQFSLAEAVLQQQAGKTIELGVVRGGESISLEITLGSSISE